MPDYTNGKLYTIRSNQTNNFYIGSTTQPLCKRLSDHVMKYKKWLETNKIFVTSFEILKYNDYYIELLKECPCNSKEELLKIEGLEIRNNINCVNKRIEGRTNKEYCKEYYEKHKEEIINYNKEYVNINKERLIEKRKKNAEKNSIYQKEHYKLNKDKKHEYCVKYHIKNKDKLNAQKHEYYINNKEKISKYHKEHYEKNKEHYNNYYETNKEKIIERNKKHYETNKEIISERRKENWKEKKENKPKLPNINELKWINKLNDVKNYIDKNKKKPSRNDENIEIKKLGDWIHSQKTSYNNQSNIMKKEDYYNKWKDFINDEQYNKYFGCRIGSRE